MYRLPCLPALLFYKQVAAAALLEHLLEANLKAETVLGYFGYKNKQVWPLCLNGMVLFFRS
jgi:hypothetical protein